MNTRESVTKINTTIVFFDVVENPYIIYLINNSPSVFSLKTKNSTGAEGLSLSLLLFGGMV